MPNADFYCGECDWSDNLFWSSSDYSDEYDDLPTHECPKCGSAVERIWHGSAPAIKTVGGATKSRSSL